LKVEIRKGHFITIQSNFLKFGTTWFKFSFLFTYVCSYKFLGKLTPILQKLVERILIYHCFCILPRDGIRIDEQHKNEYNSRDLQCSPYQKMKRILECFDRFLMLQNFHISMF